MKRYMVAIQWCGILFSYCAYAAERLTTPLKRVPTAYNFLNEAGPQPTGSSDSDIKCTTGHQEGTKCARSTSPIGSKYLENIMRDFISFSQEFQKLDHSQACKVLPERIKDARSRCQRFLVDGRKRGFQDSSVKPALEECDEKLKALLTNILHPLCSGALSSDDSALFETGQRATNVDSNCVLIHSPSPTPQSPLSAYMRQRWQSPAPLSVKPCAPDILESPITPLTPRSPGLLASGSLSSPQLQKSLCLSRGLRRVVSAPSTIEKGNLSVIENT